MRNDEERLLFSRGTGLQHRFIRDIVMGLQLERLYQLPSTEKALSSTAVLKSMAPTLCRYDEERLFCIADFDLVGTRKSKSIWYIIASISVPVLYFFECQLQRVLEFGPGPTSETCAHRFDGFNEFHLSMNFTSTGSRTQVWG